jgi:hypothetical protein
MPSTLPIASPGREFHRRWDHVYALDAPALPPANQEKTLQVLVFFVAPRTAILNTLYSGHVLEMDSTEKGSFDMTDTSIWSLGVRLAASVAPEFTSQH